MAWFSTDADCLDYLEWLRWPGGFVCPECGHGRGWRLGDARLMCAACGSRTSVTAGTIFDRTRTPLTVWFTACWLFSIGKDGISALSLKRTLEIGSYQTAWAMLHRLRSVLVRPGRDRLSGVVEVDETYFGGEEPGLRGGRAKGKKSLVAIAVERREPKGFGRCRMAILADASTDSLQAFLTDHVQKGSTGRHRRVAALPQGDRRSLHPRNATSCPDRKRPSSCRECTVSPRWPSGGCSAPDQGSADDAHLASYLGEFVFRFNRRRSRSRGMVFYRVLELAVAHEPVRYRDLVLNPQPKKNPPRPPGARGKPPSLERPPAKRPWRAADLHSSG